MAAPAVGKRVLDTGWLAARSTDVALTGVQLTTTQPPNADPAAPWMSAAVPGTYVLLFSPYPSLPRPPRKPSRWGIRVSCKLLRAPWSSLN